VTHWAKCTRSLPATWSFSNSLICDRPRNLRRLLNDARS
jgi:hypothetical protein